MKLSVCVLISGRVYDRDTHTYNEKLFAKVFPCFDDALDYLKNLDYPRQKITIHFLTH